jgi:hypothetical protein
MRFLVVRGFHEGKFPESGFDPLKTQLKKEGNRSSQSGSATLTMATKV